METKSRRKLESVKASTSAHSKDGSVTMSIDNFVLELEPKKIQLSTNEERAGRQNVSYNYRLSYLFNSILRKE